MVNVWQDLRHAFRRLRKNPGFALAAILTLALGIGANTAIFQLLEAVRLRSLPVQDPANLVEIRIADSEGARGSFSAWHAGATYAIWEQTRDRQKAFSGVFAWSSTSLSLASTGEPRLASAILATGGFFDVLGVRPVVGRLLGAEDDRKGCSAPAAVLSHAFWQRELGGDPSVVGRKISLGRYPYQIVGVAPASFTGLEVGRSFDVAVPLCAEALPSGSPNRLDSGTDWWLIVMGRLKPDWTREQASAHLAAISPGLFAASLPPNYPRESVARYLGFKLEALPGAAGISLLREQYTDSLVFLQATAGLVLLVGCANLASLMLARASARERELAVRMAFGAKRGRLVRLLLAESLLLASLGAVAGTWLAGALSGVLVSAIDSRPGAVFLDLGFDWRVFGFAAAMATLCCALFGLAPALRPARISPQNVVRGAGRGTTDDRTRLALRRVLVIGQVGLSLVLVAGAFLSARSLDNLQSQKTGLAVKDVVIAYVDMSSLGLSGERWLSFHTELYDRLRAVPGVVSVAETGVVPLSGSNWSNAVWMDGADSRRRTDSRFTHASAAYFATLRVPLVAGRVFDHRDTPEAPRVAMVNEAFARAVFGPRSALGQRFWREATSQGPAEPFEVVGVVKDTKYADLRDGMPPIAYLASSQQRELAGFAQLLIRTARAPKAMVPSLRKAIQQLGPSIVATFQDYEGMLEGSLVRDRVVAMLSGFFGVLALLLATLGLYGVIAFVVSRRTSEIGIRIALGAKRTAILRMVVTEALALVAVGLVAGLVLTVTLADMVRSLVFGLEPNDPLTLGVAGLVLGLVGVATSLLPARRAARLDPVVALRCE